MKALSLRNFRCFQDVQNARIRPLTLLVGENSTGKSSFLAAARLASDVLHARHAIDFNQEPFLLGAFDQIAHYAGGRAGRAETFEIASTTSLSRRGEGDGEMAIRHSVVFRRSGSHPVVARQTLESGRLKIDAEFTAGSRRPQLSISFDGERLPLEKRQMELFTFGPGPEYPVNWRRVSFLLRNDELKTGDHGSHIERVIRAATLTDEVPSALAPVRTRPLRTYNPISSTPLPEGEHVPMLLAKTYFAERRRWEELKTALDEFGAASGLFSSLRIKPLGRHESDPFQIRVKVSGPPSNLVDVGYGVSQVLPILVDALIGPRGGSYLLQQPEVHLHPKAQAALGSFLVGLVAAQRKTFIVETHSDFLIDRVRIDVRKKAVAPEDVSILFFERKKAGVVVHNIEVDLDGNFRGAPPTYRAFFLAEERRFLGID